MRALATVVGALTLLVAAAVPTGAQAATPSIIGGTLAEESTFPQLAHIVHESGGSGFICTGTVVAPNVVLTAAHCAENTETGEIDDVAGYTVITGNVDWNASPRQVSGVSSVVVYPSFSRTYLAGDAALLILSTPTTVPAITLASYPSDSARLEAGTDAIMAGWGETFPGQLAESEGLSSAETVVQSPTYCESNASPFYEGSELCTIKPPGHETGGCFGDSGGPLITPSPSGVGVIELGVVSHVYGECSTERPTVFTRTDLIASWVNAWIAAVRPPAPTPAPTPAPAPAPMPPPRPAPAAAPAAAPGPPNEPGYYVTRVSRTRRIVVRVAADGKHIVGLSIKMPVNCQHGYFMRLEISLLSPAEGVAITRQTARATMETGARGEYRIGHIGLHALFISSGNLEGRLRVHIPTRSRKVGLCSGTLKFTAKA